MKYTLMGFLLISAIASASMFDRSVSGKDAADLHRVAVLVSLGNTFRGDFHHGVTGFGNRSFDVPVPQWNLDRLETEHLVSLLNMGGTLQAEALLVDDLDLPKFRGTPDNIDISLTEKTKILERASQQGEDAIIIVTPVYGQPAKLALPGFGLSGSEASGKRQMCVFAYIVITAFRTSDGRTLGQQFSEPCATQTAAFDMKDAWKQYSPAEQSALEAAVKQGIDTQIDNLLARLKVTGAGRQ